MNNLVAHLSEATRAEAIDKWPRVQVSSEASRSVKEKLAQEASQDLDMPEVASAKLKISEQ